MKRVQILIVGVIFVVGSCAILGGTIYANTLVEVDKSTNVDSDTGLSEAIYDVYNTGKDVKEDYLTAYGLDLVNTDYNDNKVHIFADGSTYLIIYQNENNIDYDGPNGNITIYPFLTNSMSENNAFYQIYTINTEAYPEEYDKLRENNTKFTIDGQEIEVEYVDGVQKLAIDEYGNF